MKNTIMRDTSFLAFIKQVITVLIWNVDITPGVNKKLLSKLKGPLDRDQYVVTDIEGFQLSQRPFETIVGPDQVKLWESDPTTRMSF